MDKNIPTRSSTGELSNFLSRILPNNPRATIGIAIIYPNSNAKEKGEKLLSESFSFGIFFSSFFFIIFAAINKNHYQSFFLVLLILYNYTHFKRFVNKKGRKNTMQPRFKGCWLLLIHQYVDSSEYWAFFAYPPVSNFRLHRAAMARSYTASHW